MITNINFQDTSLVKRLFELQKAAYQVEAELINFFGIPPLKESFEEFQECGDAFIGYFADFVLAGALSYTIDGQELTICRMVVDPHHFRKGIAQSLLEFVEESNQEITILKVSTGKDNTPAKSLYLKNGYQFVSDLEVAPEVFISHFTKESAGRK